MYAMRLQEGQGGLKSAIEALVREKSLAAATVVSVVGSLSHHVRIRMAGAQPQVLGSSK